MGRRLEWRYVDAHDKELGTERPVSLTPRHSAGLVAMAEEHDWGRVGVELYYTGRQSLEADPFREVSEPYVILGVLVAFVAAVCVHPSVTSYFSPLFLGVSGASVLGAVALSLLELFVAFLQAYIFTFLSALFIGMAVHPH